MEIVVAGHAGDLAVGYGDEDGSGDRIGLAGRFGEVSVLRQVLAVNGELGGAAVAVRHHDEVLDPFVVATAHVLPEGGVRGFADFGPAFVNVVDDIFGKGGEEGVFVVAVESFEVGVNQPLGIGHRYEFGRLYVR